MANEVVVEDENEGTVLTFPAAVDISADDVLYLMQGTGSDRDRHMTLGALMGWIAGEIEGGDALDSILFEEDHSTYKNVLFANGDGVEISNAMNGSQTALSESLFVKVKTEYLQYSKTSNNVLRETVLTADGLEFRRGTGTNRTKATVTLNLQTNRLEIDVRNGLELTGSQVIPQRLNLGSDKSSFKVSSDADIDTLLSSTTVDVEEGDIVTVVNEGGSTITVYFGYIPSVGTFSLQLMGYCAMSFFCTYAQGGYYGWAPLGNVTVTVTPPAA